jgi:hypothetical protein
MVQAWVVQHPDSSVNATFLSIHDFRSRFDYRMRVTAAFALRLILPKKHNDVKMTQNHSKQLPNTLPSAQMNGHMKGDKGTHFRPLTLSPMSHMPASDIGEPG